ncbi:MAG: hypothetical protein Q4G69_03495 [Planctomycetia bacterium]|nr:hypothetical protein [Planctomycetia bacterium]
MSALNINNKKKEKKPKPEKKAKVKKPPVAKVKKPKKKVPVDIYTLILLIAWLALTAACIIAYLDIKSYPAP